MRVLILVSQISQGSAELLAVDLAQDLSKMGVDVSLASLRVDNKDKVKISNFENIDFHCLGYKSKHKLFNLIRIIFKLRKIIIQNKIDIIETSSPSLGIIGSISIYGTNIRLLSGLHETFFKGKNKIKGGNTNSIRKKLFSFLTTIKSNVYFYAISEFVKQTWINYSDTLPKKIKVINDAIKLPSESINKAEAREKILTELNLPMDSKLLLCLGRIASYRRQDFLIKAFLESDLEKNIYLIIAGDPDYSIPSTKIMMSEIKNLITKYNSSFKVKFIGHRKEIYTLIQASDLLVHPTDMEGFGLTLVEAMYLGLPIIASKVEAIPEIVPEPENILFEKASKNELIKAIKIILSRSESQKKDASEKNKLTAKKFSNRKERAKEIYSYMKEIISN